VKTGLTGRACVLDESEPRRARAAAIAEREGALVETFTAPWTRFPFESEVFDVVVVRDVVPRLDGGTRIACLAEVRRVLRKGGRCLVIDSGGSGFGRLFRPAGPSGTDVVRALESAGFRAARTLAERDRMVFVEAVRGTDN
jgi:SAM-dependent methyltransferase